MYEGELVRLRALDNTDLENILQFYNDWNLRRWLGVPLPESSSTIREWLERGSRLRPWKDGSLVLAIEDRDTNEFVGISRIYDIKRPHDRASIGIAIYDPNQKLRGFGTDATLVTLWIGFNILGLNSIYLDTMEGNDRAIAVAEKAGFRRIGVFRETEFVDGEYRDLLYMDILKEEFMSWFPNGRKVSEGAIKK
ncbi:MAG: hypothetical protein BAJATHORv1_20369 [Candidatus Thorarchaeota archaeon]|nr:MAG: hypothetical protein BAJATHORv1_20369 [Candidatus Thorarchaeota archaeon]